MKDEGKEETSSSTLSSFRLPPSSLLFTSLLLLMMKIIFAAILMVVSYSINVVAQTQSNPTAKPPAPLVQATPPVWLDRRVRDEVAKFEGTVKLYAKNLDTGAEYSFDGDDAVRTASTIKIGIMIEAFTQVAEGKVKWTDELVLTKEKKIAGSGILQEFMEGLHLTLRDAVTLMMVMSDNTATNLVIDALGGADSVNARMKTLGLTQTRLMRKVGGGGDSEEGKKEENKRFGLGRTSPHEMASLIERLERGEIVNPSVSREMIDLMKREQTQDGIWRELWRLPRATKSGALDALRSNVGIIYHTRGRIVLAITCDDMPEPNWTADNPAYLVMSRLSEIVIDGLGK